MKRSKILSEDSMKFCSLFRKYGTEKAAKPTGVSGYTFMLQ